MAKLLGWLCCRVGVSFVPVKASYFHNGKGSRLFLNCRLCHLSHLAPTEISFADSKTVSFWCEFFKFLQNLFHLGTFTTSEHCVVYWQEDICSVFFEMNAKNLYLWYQLLVHHLVSWHLSLWRSVWIPLCVATATKHQHHQLVPIKR